MSYLNEHAAQQGAEHPPMNYLFHVTPYNRLESIDEHGLHPGYSPSIGGSLFEIHREGAIFLTEAVGVLFWASKLEEWGEHYGDLYEDQLAPVVLRVPASFARVCTKDIHGTISAGADAYKCKISIPPEEIEIWVGTCERGDWRPIEEWMYIPYDNAFEWETIGFGGEEYSTLKDAYGGTTYLGPDIDMLEAD